MDMVVYEILGLPPRLVAHHEEVLVIHDTTPSEEYV
jgi:hypothetical protein